MKSTYKGYQEEQQKSIIIQQFIKSLNDCSINNGQKLKKRGLLNAFYTNFRKIQNIEIAVKFT